MTVSKFSCLFNIRHSNLVQVRKMFICPIHFSYQFFEISRQVERYVKICETATLRLLPILCPSYQGSMVEFGAVQGLIGHHLLLNKIKTSLHSGQCFESHLKSLFPKYGMATFIITYNLYVVYIHLGVYSNLQIKLICDFILLMTKSPDKWLRISFIFKSIWSILISGTFIFIPISLMYDINKL